jgi:hypothetical protein
MILRQDDFQVGQIVTVLNNKRVTYQTVTKTPTETVMLPITEKAWVGTIMCIKSIELPFVIVRYFSNKMVCKAILDTRDLDFSELPEEFAQQLIDNVEVLKEIGGVVKCT